MQISTLYQLFKESSGITTDSRRIQPGSMYVALRGDRFDGNTFAAQALKEGASYAIIDRKEYKVDKRTILVENSLETLQKLANYHRYKLDIPIIGITGTNGKTTTKELVRAVLSERFKVWATEGNLNNHIGVPLTLLSMTEDTQIGVVEMGANHPFEIEQLCEIAAPDFGLITNIGKAHLEGFGGFQGVIKTKKELYDYLISQKGTIFYNADNALLSGLIENANVSKISYGQHSGDFYRGTIVRADPFLEIEIVRIADGMEGPKVSVKTNLVGDYNFENILAAACVGSYFNIPMEDIGKAIGNYMPTNSRSQLLQTAKNKVLLDCYNANPSSTEAAIVNFSRIKDPNKIAILGDMLELGEESESEHLRILKILSSFKDIKALLVGKYYKIHASIFDFTAFSSSEEIKQWLVVNPITDSLILVKGSRGIQLEKIVENL
jgi:UDP-N-acetylmuramoyl-tripeptide--D-alanyl-D-alanine ligase